MLSRCAVPALAVIICALTAGSAHADSWALGSDLKQARTAYALVTLDNGSLLAIGGAGPDASKGAERYSPTTGAWAEVASMTTPRGGMVAATLDDGRVLVAGGNGTGTSAEIYDPVGDGWTPVATGLRNWRGGPNTPIGPTGGIARMAGGRFLVPGAGFTGGPPTATAQADIFDPAAASGAGAFSAAHDMGTARAVPLVAPLPDGRVLVAGGTSATTTSLSSGEVYDPATDLWTPVANSMAGGHAFGFAVPLADGKVLIGGGLTGPLAGPGGAANTDAELYDPATNRFTATGEMSVGHTLGFAARLPDGRVVAGGGAASFTFGAPPAPTKVTEVYDPAAGAWRARKPMPTGALGLTAATLPSGQLLAAGGTTGASPGSPVFATTQLYTPSLRPGAPQALTAVAGNGSATITWAPPASDGGAPIEHYTVTASSGQAVATTDARTSLVVAGLANGEPVTFTVAATNDEGDGPVATSAAVTPSAPEVTPSPSPSASPTPTPTPPVVTPPAPDKTAPTLKISGLKRTLKLAAFRKGVRATITPSEAASLSVQLVASASTARIAKTYNLTLATKSYGRSAGARKISLKPNRRLVGRARRFSVVLRILATDAAGNARTVTTTIKVAR